jgi:nucleotide-binding universal stress UspA family protein
VIIEEEGFVSEIVLKNAVKYKCDLILLGTYGASGYRSGYIGSNTYSIVKFAPCPVLIIPGGKRPAGFNRPLFPVRPVMASESSIKDLNRVVAEIQSNLAEGRIETKTQWSEGSTIAEDILSQADKNNSDLIILSPAIDVSTKQFYIGPIAHRVIHHTRVPILVINKVNIYTSSTKAAAN